MKEAPKDEPVMRVEVRIREFVLSPTHTDRFVRIAKIGDESWQFHVDDLANAIGRMWREQTGKV